MKRLTPVIILILAVVLFLYLAFAPRPATPAILYVEGGTVDLDSGSGWQSAEDETQLGINNRVRTKEGAASIVFWESEIMHLEPYTEVKISKLNSKIIDVYQHTGETWNKITGISGIVEYKVETRENVAIAKGTEFILNDDEVLVNEGEVHYRLTHESEGIKVMSRTRVLGTNLEEQPFSDQESYKFKMFKTVYAGVLSKVRDREIQKHEWLLKIAARRGLTEEKMRTRLEAMDKGELNADNVYRRMPNMIKPRARRAYLLTKEISRAHKLSK